jgi:threo-3-hydroxy-L-aspartate ammonia-lyase
MLRGVIPALDDVRAAAVTIADHVHRTPVLSSATLSEVVGAPVTLKAELLQRSGSFKVRGAFNRLSSLTGEERARGVIGVSAGNHAQALALAARELGTTALVLMPPDASQAKVDATRGYGGEVDLESADAAEMQERMVALAESTGRVIVHPFNDPAVQAGGGTVGLELVEQVANLDTVIVPVGGGGLITGVAAAVKALVPGSRVIGVEPELAPSVRRALDAGEVVQVDLGPTIADALKTPSALPNSLEGCRTLVDDIVLVSEQELIDAIRFVYTRAKLACEAGGAAGVAALLSGRIDVRGASGVAVVISGGNIAPDLLARILV